MKVVSTQASVLAASSSPCRSCCVLPLVWQKSLMVLSCRPSQSWRRKCSTVKSFRVHRRQRRSTSCSRRRTWSASECWFTPGLLCPLVPLVLRPSSGFGVLLLTARLLLPGFLCSLRSTRSASRPEMCRTSSPVCRTTQSTCDGALREHVLHHPL